MTRMSISLRPQRSRPQRAKEVLSGRSTGILYVVFRVGIAVATADPTKLILLLQGEAEARLLVDVDAAIQVVFAGQEVSVLRAWSTRPDWLAAGGPAAPRALIESGAYPDIDVRALLEKPPRLVVFSLLPSVTLPALKHREGGALLAPQSLLAGWTPETADRMSAECTEEPPMSPAEAAAALEPIIERLQERGAAVALCTAFRHVRTPPEEDGRARAAALRDVIRRLNIEVARLSQRTGCFVLDLDRLLAHEGGVALDADCFGGDGRAAEIALEEFAALLAEALPDDITAFEFS